MPTFVANGPLVPPELIQDLEDDRVVLFCGAGISMEAGLPDFSGLVRCAYQAMNLEAPAKRDRAWLWPDRMLGDLERRCQPGEVRSAIRAELERDPATLTMHRALLKLAQLRRHPGLRLVTTNFDTYFEKADSTPRPGIHLHSGPILPIPRDDRTAS